MWLLGDFVLIVRFGGQHATTDEGDVSKVLFRYVGNTAFLSEGTTELRKKQVDMMRRYAAGFEDDQFLLELDFKAAGPQDDAPSGGASTMRRSLPSEVKIMATAP